MHPEVTVSHEKPVLDKVLKNVRKEVVSKNTINENIVQYHIEIREQPIEKLITHDVQEVVIQEEPIIEEEGKTMSDEERRRIHQMMNVKPGERYIDKDGVEIVYAEPEIRQVRRIVRRRIIRPIITEVIEQPVYEIVEQPIEKLADMKPSTTTIINDRDMYDRLMKERGLQSTSVRSGGAAESDLLLSGGSASIETYVTEPVQYNTLVGGGGGGGGRQQFVQRHPTATVIGGGSGGSTVNEPILQATEGARLSQLPLDQQRNAAVFAGETHPAMTREGATVAHQQQFNAAAVQEQREGTSSVGQGIVL